MTMTREDKARLRIRRHIAFQVQLGLVYALRALSWRPFLQGRDPPIVRRKNDVVPHARPSATFFGRGTL